MIRAWLVCAGAMLLVGCPTGVEPVRGAQKGVDPPKHATAPPAVPEAPAEIPEPEPREPERLVVGTTEVRQEPKRDLGAELKSALGVPSDCIRDFVAPRPMTIRVSVSGIVRPTGMVIEPSAYGSGLSAAALECIKQRIGIVVLDPLPDGEKSETATTIIEMEYEPPVVIESVAGVPEPHLKNVKEPLPKRPEVAPSGKPIQEPTSKPIQGGKSVDPSGPQGRPITGPKPRAIDGYEVDENAQQWR